MQALPVLWIVWAALTVVLLALLVYRGTLTRYEEDCLFLDDSANQQKHEQEVIMTRLRRVQPALKFMTVGTCVMSAAILSLYVWDAIRAFSL
jgi:peptidoglycan/LPS O-acetylase OafA/YrhL